MTRVLAIDPGSALGWATNASGRLEWSTMDFSVKRGESSGNRWRRFEAWLDEAAGQFPIVHYKPGHEQDARAIVEELRRHERVGIVPPSGVEIIQAPKVDLIVYERATFTMPNRAYSDVLAGFYALLEKFAEDHQIALQPVAVQTLKAFALPQVARPKRLKGESVEAYQLRAPRMDRGKAAMIRAAEHRLVLNHGARVRSTGDGINAPVQAFIETNLGEHEADALWLYFYAQSGAAR